MQPNLDDTGDVQLRGIQAKTGIHTTKQQDGEDIGKVSNEGPDLEAGGKWGQKRQLMGWRNLLLCLMLPLGVPALHTDGHNSPKAFFPLLHLMALGYPAHKSPSSIWKLGEDYPYDTNISFSCKRETQIHFLTQQEDQQLPFFPPLGKIGAKSCRRRCCSYLGGEVAAEFELLQGERHGVGPKEEDEGHEGQVGHEFTGFPH